MGNDATLGRERGRVRPGRASDHGELEVVFDEAERLHREALPHVFRAPAGTFPTGELFDEWLRDPDAAVLVAELDGLPVGFCVAHRMSTPAGPVQQAREIAHVDLLAVSSAVHGRGLGRLLMSTVEAWARSQLLDAVQLNVWEFNEAALRFYDAIGYTTASRVMEHRL